MNAGLPARRACVSSTAPPGSAGFEEAVREVDRAIELDASLAAAWLQRAVGLAMAGDMTGAETSLRHAVDHAGDDPRPVSMLAELLMRTGREAEARALLESAAHREAHGGELGTTRRGPAGAERTPTGGVQHSDEGE